MNCTTIARVAFATVFVTFLTPTLFAQLVVDRSTGSLMIDMTDAPLSEINGYSINSNNGLLDPNAWTSLVDQGLPGWFEANPSHEFLTELNPLGSVMPSEPWDLGTAYTGLTAAPRDEDLTFHYSSTDGSVVKGMVTYTGPANDLVLRVDPVTGFGSIALESGMVGPFDVVGFSIFSDAGALATEGFTGLGAGWTDASSSVALAQLSFEGKQLFDVDSAASVGSVYAVGGEQDLRFEFATSDGAVLPGTVIYMTLATSGDCNADGVVDIFDANCTAAEDLESFLASLTPPSTTGDATGDGKVDFSDFLVLSGNFNADGQYTDGDFDKDGAVMFSDFLILSSNFGSPESSAAIVPEPSALPLVFIAGICGLLVLRTKSRSAFCLAATMMIVWLVADANVAQAVDLDTRMIVLDAENPGANSQINNALEARNILRGIVDDVAIAEDVTGTVDFIDFAGDAGAFNLDNPYPNGVNDSSLSDFVVHVTGHLEIPAGDWTIGFNTDDGGILSMPRVEFVATGNENGATGEPGELIYNGTRGFDWTFGHLTVPAGETLRTEFEAIAFERGGGDGFEVAIIDGFTDGSELGDFGLEFGDDAFDWKVLAEGPAAGDFNWDDEVDFADFLVLANNFGTGTHFADGDANRDGSVDLFDFVTLVPLLEQPAATATAVPEPRSMSLMLCAFLASVADLRRRSRCFYTQRTNRQ